LRAVEVGSIIHDIGKIGIPDGILTKPGRLTDEEFDAMRKHPEISSYIVAELDLPVIVQHMVRSHHERWDGGGYPDGLAGEDIPLAARILQVADIYDALITERSYKRALSQAESFAVMEEESRRGWRDPELVPLFISTLQAQEAS